MRELCSLYPDIEDLLALEPEELGAKLLFLLRKRFETDKSFLAGLNVVQAEPFAPQFGATYNSNKRNELNLAIAEAWSWLEAQGLLVPAPEINGVNGYRILSRRARKFEDERDVSQFTTGRMLTRECLNPRIAHAVWGAFVRREYDNAVLQAMKAVEVSVREATGLAGDVYGHDLMVKAFNEKTGILTDFENPNLNERNARFFLFSGAIGAFRNPHAHRDINIDNPVEAIELVLLANHLLRIVDNAKNSLGKAIRSQ